MLDNNIIKELYPDADGMLVKPMLIHASTDAQLKQAAASGDWFGQLKKDGALYMFVKGHTGTKYMFGRSISKKTGTLSEKGANVPHILSALDVLPNETILIGEVYYPGGSSRNTTEIMGCLPKKAVDRQEGEKGYIHYYIHDIIMYDGVDFIKNKVDNETRYEILKRIYSLHGLLQYDFLELAESWTDRLYERVGEALAAGEEGMVFKLKKGLYEPEKRPSTNLKAKKVDYADVVIIGFEAPTKEYYGRDIENWQYWQDADGNNLDVGFHMGEENVYSVTKPYYMGWNNARIKIGAYDSDHNMVQIGTIHSGITDEMKAAMSDAPDNYLYAVAKIQMMEVDKVNKTVRHGFFRGMHPEKVADTCLISDIF